MSDIRRNAIIMAAGMSSRFVPLSSETPKGLLEVRGEVLIERQIRQLREAGITDITIVVGYMADKFSYLIEKYGIELVLNEDFSRYNNTSSMIRVLDRLGDTYVCSSDNYIANNVFLEDPCRSYYSALYANGPTCEYCVKTDSKNNITGVSIGGHDSWYMIGHVYFSNDFSSAFRILLTKEYEKEEVRLGYWEDVYIRHIDHLPLMTLKRYGAHEIEEFDTLDELRAFDSSYISDTRSSILKEISSHMQCGEEKLNGFKKIKHEGDSLLFSFRKDNEDYVYDEQDNSITKL